MGTDIHIAAEYFKKGHWRLANVDLPDDRNYFAFAVLADVRNGYTFAGFDSGDPVMPISEPRGLPEDLSEELRAQLEDVETGGIWLGDHSFSWVTLEELLNYNLDAPCIRRGMVPPEEAARYKAGGGRPRISAAWHRDPSWVRLVWEEPLRNETWLIPLLIDAITPLGKPGHVRLVFGFDT